MTAPELIAELRALGGSPDAARIFLHLAEHVYEARLANGARLLDASDFKEWLVELAEEAKIPRPPYFPARAAPSPQTRYDHICPDCGHEHEGRTDCGKYLGEEKFCPCESRVRA